MRIELELDEAKGEIVGDVPEPIKALFARIENTAHGAGFGKGAAKAAEEAKAQIAAAVAAEKAKLEAMAPLEKEKYLREAEENKTLKQQMLESSREMDRAMKTREEAHALAVARTRRRAEEAQRADRGTDEGATPRRSQGGWRAGRIARRARSHPPFVHWLQRRHGAVREERRWDAQNGAGQGQSLGSFVKEYLDGHTHHKRPAAGAGWWRARRRVHHGHAAHR
jgi:hypothetical protein